MRPGRLAVISMWLTAAGLAAVLPFVRPPFLAVALAALGLRLTLLPGRPAAYELFVVLVNLAALPIVAGSLWLRAELMAALLVIPGLPWLAAALGRAAATVATGIATCGVPLTARGVLPRLPRGRRMTPYLSALVLGLLALALVGIVTGQGVLVGSALVVLAFLSILVGVSYARIPPRFLAARPVSVRVLARDTIEAAPLISSRARTPLWVILQEPFGWTKIAPLQFSLDGRDPQIGVRLTPPLAGPSTVRATAAAVDAWGLTVAYQEVDLVRLRVIPRARYAAWLARRYLEQARGGALTAAVSAGDRAGGVRRGTEYYGARNYEPGDVLRDVFWKKTLKLSQLVVKDRRDEHGEAVIVVANLAATDPDEADTLAYNLLMSALTLAQDGVPLAYAAYTAAGVVAATGPLAQRAAVRYALELIESIQVAPIPARVLHAPEVTRLRRNIARLVSSRAEPAMRLARILTFEHMALLQRAQAHPATAALRATIARLQPPAAVLVVSRMREADVLEMMLERLGEKGYRVIHPVQLESRLGPHMSARRVRPYRDPGR